MPTLDLVRTAGAGGRILARCGLLLVFVLVACGDRQPRGGDTDRVVSLLYQSGPDTFDPGAARSQRARFILGRLLGAGLCERDRDGVLLPVLATAPPEDLGAGYRFDLRPEARWPDGRPVLAEDFRRSFAAARGGAGGMLAAAWAGVDDLVIEGPGRFRVVCGRVGLVQREALALDLLPLPSDWSPGQELLAGPGAFELVRSDAGSTELNRKADWWGDAVEGLRGRYQVDRLRLRYDPDLTRSRFLLRSGAVDLAAIEPAEAGALQREGFAVHAFASGSFSFAGFSCRGGPCRDPGLRRILADSVPRADLARSFPELGPRPRLDGAAVEEPGLASISRALDRLDLLDRDGDGLREGSEGALRLRLLAATGTIPWLDSLLLRWRERLRRCGIELEIERLDLRALLGRLEGGDFDLFVLVWRQDGELDSLRALLHSDQIGPGGRNFAALADPQIDQAIERLEAAPERVLALAARRLLADRVAALAPLVPLFDHQLIVAHRPRGLVLPFGARGPYWPGMIRR